MTWVWITTVSRK